jgi:hypothetical protein
MKFSELDATSWPALAPYLDTCLLPVTGLAGAESPDEMTERVAAAGAWLSPIERDFKGRTVTLPAYHYYDGSDRALQELTRMCGLFRQSGFRFVVLVTGVAGLLPDLAEADLILQPLQPGEQPEAGALRQAITDMWKGAAPATGSFRQIGQAQGE